LTPMRMFVSAVSTVSRTGCSVCAPYAWWMHDDRKSIFSPVEYLQP
jgi:hypothetical protein